MSETELYKTSVIPRRTPAWITYTQHQRLVQLTQRQRDGDESAIAALWDFLINTAKLPLAEDAPDSVVIFNAFQLQVLGYKPEELTQDEYTALRALYLRADEATIDDMDLYPEGNHRNLYNFITRTIGLTVEAGRGPVWHRAMKLLQANAPRYEPVPAMTIEAVQP